VMARRQGGDDEGPPHAIEYIARQSHT
jgi:hypothetical protein